VPLTSTGWATVPAKEAPSQYCKSLLNIVTGEQQ
jgi:hypothetical protein